MSDTQTVAERFEKALYDDDKFSQVYIHSDLEKTEIREIQQWLNHETGETVFLVDNGVNGADLMKNKPTNDIDETLDYVGVDVNG